MIDHLALSRITKAFTDGGEVDFAEAEQRLAAVRLAVVIDNAALRTAAGQACVLTSLATGRRTFEHVTLITNEDVNLIRPQPSAMTLHGFARELDVGMSTVLPEDTTHVIAAGDVDVAAVPAAFRCWWDGWLSGVLPEWDEKAAGESWNPLAGTFAGALAVREVFADIRGVKAMNLTGNIVSLWEPWSLAENAERGPRTVHLARAMMIVGLGHLGQALLWNLALLPAHGDHLVLQDHQQAGPENAPTGLLTTTHDIGRRKTRIASDWIQHFGWSTALIERKFHEWVKAEADDPVVVISAVDKPEPRRHVLGAGYHLMLDIGVGHGPADFESGQFRSFMAGDAATWNEGNEETNVDARLNRKAYQALSDQCGAFQLASASVAVPFVGAALGAICVAQLLRIGAMRGISKLFHIELTAPELPSFAAPTPDGPAGFGSVEIDLAGATHSN